VRGGSSLLRVVFPGFGRWVAPNGVLVVVPSGGFSWFRKVGGTERGAGGGSFGWVAAVSKGGWHRMRGGFERWVAPNEGWFRKVGGTE
jgi:hypothetical protein